MKKPLKKAKTVELITEIIAFEVKWTCPKGHINHVTLVADTKGKDVCLKCLETHEVCL